MEHLTTCEAKHESWKTPSLYSKAQESKGGKYSVEIPAGESERDWQAFQASNNGQKSEVETGTVVIDPPAP